MRCTSALHIQEHWDSCSLCADLCISTQLTVMYLQQYGIEGELHHLGAYKAFWLHFAGGLELQFAVATLKIS